LSKGIGFTLLKLSFKNGDLNFKKNKVATKYGDKSTNI
jgi:hypothetical protein